MTAKVETLFEEHFGLIGRTIRRNHALLAALQLEEEDVSQDLSIRMISALNKFDPARSESIEKYIVYSLQYEILNMKRRYKPKGIVGVPDRLRLEFTSISEELPDGGYYELPSFDDLSEPDFMELFDVLTEPEIKTVAMKVRGQSVRRKAQKAALASARGKYEAIYYEERRAAA